MEGARQAIRALPRPLTEPVRVLFAEGTYLLPAPVAFDEATVSATLRAQRETHLVLTLGEGTARCRFWTTDLTQEYVHLNADYTT